MKFYQEITLLPNVGDEIPLTFIWEKLYQQLHLAFVESVDDQGKVNIGVSFPKYKSGDEKRWLGDKLRIFAESEQALEMLCLAKWLSRLSDYTHMSSIKSVPEHVDGYAVFRRLNKKSNIEKLARRRAKKLDISLDDALAFFKDTEQRQQSDFQASDYPFFWMKSLSSGSKYPVAVVREDVGHHETRIGFSTYGLSLEDNDLRSAVPIFR